ncbi:MAG: efflux RND transporter periplasmic adaptor subunit [Bacteroidales bacterium]|nr:efflux RND transporter periplasmic adaptor subunit [Bacteroidales bacterium]
MTNNFKLQKTIFIFFILTIFFSCTNKETEWDKNDKSDYVKEKNLVDTMILSAKTFHQELVSNGRLEAIRKVELRFRVSGEIKNTFFTNGCHVEKGELIAQLNDFTLKNDLHKNKINLAKSMVNFEDVLIGQGYNINDTASVPQDFLHIAKVKSGYTNALIDLSNAKYRLQGTKLIAPFSGVLADITKIEYDKINEGENYCILIDNEYFHVKFSVLESELEYVFSGKKVNVKPLSGGQYLGKIAEINPIVNKNGLITIYARIKNSSAKLLEGMNVDVKIRTDIEQQLVIPKTAVVLRQNKEVIFTLKNDSIAIWNYVETSYENTRYCTIKKGLEPKDIIITSGNTNLAHESLVEVNSDKKEKL